MAKKVKTETKISHTTKEDLIQEIKNRQEDKIIEKTNAELLIKLIENAKDLNETINIAALGTTYKRTGFHFDKRLEKLTNDMKYFKKNEKLSFEDKNDKNAIHHKLIIGDNYDALQNLLIQYSKKIDVIYIDPPYGKDSMGEFADTNYDNAITRDNLLSMLYNRLVLAKQLLTDDGVIFCSIDDRNQAYVKCLFDEVFGERNFVNTVFVLDNLKGKTNDNYIASVGSKLIIYVNNKIKNNDIGFKEVENIFGDRVDEKFKYEDEKGIYSLITFKKTGQSKYREDRPNMFYPILEKNNKLYTITDEEYSRIYNSTTKKFDDKYLISLKNKYRDYNFILPISDNNEMLRWTSSFSTFKIKINDDIIYDYGVKQKNRPQPQEMIQVYASGTPKSFMYKPSYANGTADLFSIIGKEIFVFPKPIDLLIDILNLINNKNAIVLDFFAGSGTTGQAVLELNKEDGGNRQFILCTNNEITELNPKGIALDVTTKRLKRVMTGKCYDGKSNFEWIKKNEALGGALDVYDIKSVANFEKTKEKTAFDVIDETLYGKEKFKKVSDKIKWVCENFEHTQMTEETNKGVNKNATRSKRSTK